jgi:L-ascorbate metabolism protein UlaG (beta-lactamase superfamily)
VTLAWLGHATVLINFYGVRIITDPALYARIGVDLGVATLGPERLVQCALTPDDVPDIDLVLVSHAHFDHLDTPSLGSIRGKPAAVMASETSDLLPRRPYSSVRELRWNEAATIATPRGDVLVRSIEVKHWGTRILRDTWRGYTGWIVEREPEKRGKRRCADPYTHNHCTPEQAVAMADAAGARTSFLHHRSFRLSNETVMELIERLRRARESDGWPARDRRDRCRAG